MGPFHRVATWYHLYSKVLDNVAQLLRTHDFVFGRVHYLAKELDWTSQTPPSDSSISAPDSSPLEYSDRAKAAFKFFDAQLKAFTSSLPPCTALIIFTGCCDPRPLGVLNRRKAQWDAKIRSGIMNDAMPENERWSTKDSELLEKACEAAKAGLAFFCVTRP